MVADLTLYSNFQVNVATTKKAWRMGLSGGRILCVLELEGQGVRMMILQDPGGSKGIRRGSNRIECKTGNKKS